MALVVYIHALIFDGGTISHASLQTENGDILARLNKFFQFLRARFCILRINCNNHYVTLTKFTPVGEINI